MGETDKVALLRPEFTHLDTLNAQEFSDRFGSPPEGAETVLLDMGLVEYVDSSGLGAILALVRETLSRGGRIAICGAKPSVRVLFKMVKLAKLLPVFDTLEEGRSWTAGT